MDNYFREEKKNIFKNIYTHLAETSCVMVTKITRWEGFWIRHLQFLEIKEEYCPSTNLLPSILKLYRHNDKAHVSDSNHLA